ncbi:MAG: aminoglycoside phosphotransferase family protein [Dehalococcoidia bacterium]|nr:aminoglycoside phosphotransferase family protein [Dehalococcoidia bacterium]
MGTGTNKGQLLARGRTAQIFAWGDDRVLKLYHAGHPAASVDYEAMVMKAVHAAGIPAPEVDNVIEVENRRGIIMERVWGPTMVDLMVKRLWKTGEYARILADLHVRMNRAHVAGPEPMHLKLWYEIARIGQLPAQMKQELMKVLMDLPVGNSVCHFDLHPMNVIMSARGPVVIDWEGAGTGNPILDIARSWLLITQAALPISFTTRIIARPVRNLFCSTYIRQYHRLCAFDDDQFRTARLLITAARLGEGIPEEEQQLLNLLESLIAHKNIPYEAQNVS